MYDWTDDVHEDALAPVPGTRREVLVWIWYPAVGQSGATSDYVPVQIRPPAGGGSSVLSWLTRDWSKVHAHGIDKADVSPQQRSYPVLIMRGGASAPVINYTTLAEDLASHGYIVVGIDAPYRTGRVVFPDGRVIERTAANNPELLVGRPEQAGRLNQIFAAWIDDMRFVLDRLEQLNASDASGKFTGRFDMTRVGALGHSFGGAQAAQFCHEDSRCKAGIDIDGAPFGSVIQAGIQKPFMFLLSDRGQSSDPESRQIEGDIGRRRHRAVEHPHLAIRTMQDHRMGADMRQELVGQGLVDPLHRTCRQAGREQAIAERFGVMLAEHGGELRAQRLAVGDAVLVAGKARIAAEFGFADLLG